MNYKYFEKLSKMVDHHLNESKGWAALYDKCKKKDDLFGCGYCIRKQNEHNQMASYFLYALTDLHYVPGTWRQVWGQAK